MRKWLLLELDVNSRTRLTEINCLYSTAWRRHGSCPTRKPSLKCSRLLLYSFTWVGVGTTHSAGVCVCVPISLSLLTLGENMEPVSTSITHLIHHWWQAEEFWCQLRAGWRNAQRACVWGGSHQPCMLSLLFVFLLYIISFHEAHVCPFGQVHCVSIPLGQAEAGEATLLWQGRGTWERTGKGWRGER